MSAIPFFQTYRVNSQCAKVSRISLGHWTHRHRLATQINPPRWNRILSIICRYMWYVYLFYRSICVCVLEIVFVFLEYCGRYVVYLYLYVWSFCMEKVIKKKMMINTPDIFCTHFAKLCSVNARQLYLHIHNLSLLLWLSEASGHICYTMW